MLRIFLEFSLLLSLAASKTPPGLADFCQLETFRASCGVGHVIVMLTARYGRMRRGRCVRRDYGSLGCSTDVLPSLDVACSGRPECELPVAALHDTNKCPEDLTSFLETSYACEPVLYPDCPDERPHVVTSTSGTLAVGTQATRCPWRIDAEPGQNISLSLLYFGEPISGARRCRQLFVVAEAGSSRTVSYCGSDARQQRVYVSRQHQLRVHTLLRAPPHYLLKYQVNGCPLPEVPSAAWTLREGDRLRVKCNFTREQWTFTCRGRHWEGSAANCSLDSQSDPYVDAASSFPYGRPGILVVVSIGVALGVFCGGILLAMVSYRMRSSANRRRRPYCDLELSEKPCSAANLHPAASGTPCSTTLHRHMFVPLNEWPVTSHVCRERCELNSNTCSAVERVATSNGDHVYESPPFIRKGKSRK